MIESEKGPPLCDLSLSQFGGPLLSLIYRKFTANLSHLSAQYSQCLSVSSIHRRRCHAYYVGYIAKVLMLDVVQAEDLAVDIVKIPLLDQMLSCMLVDCKLVVFGIDMYRCGASRSFHS